MTNRESILKTIRFIEENLKSDISIMDIAAHGCYSLYHFYEKGRVRAFFFRAGCNGG